ncbi:uncharacterized protein LOC107306621 [Coturnix japonica]|uniref:uncharacterized protein LOC107306621 n=1 Tax=Coturnix japonica TaxID=93934 RepID=UPI0007775669|nr:uncharacterized protein LOC107306621 [Coturnix japonica]
MAEEQDQKAHSQADKRLPSVREQRQVGRRPQQAVLPGRQSQDLSVRGNHLPQVPHPVRAQASGSRRAQADRPQGRQSLPALPPLPRRVVSLPAAPQNAATARGRVPTFYSLPAIASRSFPRGRAASAVGATSSRVAAPGLQGNPQHQDMAVRAEGWQADLCGPALPLKPAERTPKSLRLAYWVRLGATRPGACLKQARPGRRAPTSTVRPPAGTTQVLAPKAGKGPEDETRHAASAQEDSGDAHRVSTSRSLAAEQAAEKEAEQAAELAADNGAKGAGTSQAMLDAKSSKERAHSAMSGGSFLPCCLCCSTCSAVLTDQQEEKKDITERDTVAVAGKEPVSTSLPGAESLAPVSPVPGKLQHEMSKAQVNKLEIRDTFTHSSISGEERQPLPTCGPSLCIPAPPLKPAHATRKFYNLAYKRHPLASRPGTYQKPAGLRQRAPTSTEETSAQATQLLAPQVGSSLTRQTPPAPSAQEDTGDAVKDPSSHSLVSEWAAEHGARAAGTPQDMLDDKDDEERAWSDKRENTSYCLCCSTCNNLMDEDE